jgi:hypothetical protein
MSPWSLVQIPSLPTFLSEDWNQGLTSGAKAGATVLNGNPLDGAAANRAGFAPLMSNLEIKMSCAQFALGTDIGIHAGAFAADSCSKNSADAIM